MDVRRISTALLVVPLLALGACGGTDSSIADPPVSSAPTSAPTADPPQRETPEHFIRRWAALEKSMENTGDASEYLSVSRSCEACRSLARQIKGFYSAGGYVKWGGWHIISIKPYSKASAAVTYAVRNASRPTTYKEAANGPTKHLAGGVTTELLSLVRSGGTWQVQNKAELAS